MSGLHREPGDPDGPPRATPGAPRVRATIRAADADRALNEARARLDQQRARRAAAPRRVVPPGRAY